MNAAPPAPDVLAGLIDKIIVGQPLVVVLLIAAVFVLWRDSVAQRGAMTALAVQMAEAVREMKAAVERLADEIRTKH